MVQNRAHSDLRQLKLTPGVVLNAGPVSDLADVGLSGRRGEGGVPGEVEVPALVEGQVGLLGAGQLHAVPQELDLDVGRVEAAHVADQGVALAEHCGAAAVHLDLGRGWENKKQW